MSSDTIDRTAIIKECIDLHELMTKHVLAAGIGEKKWNQLIGTLNKRTDRRVLCIHQFLTRIHAFEWRAIETTWTLPNATEEMWENMHNAFDDVVFPEMVRLKADRRALRDVWAVFKEKYQRILSEERITGKYEASLGDEDD